MEGDVIDLGILRRTFPSSVGGADPQVQEDADGFYFESERLDDFEDIGNDGHRVAEQIVREMNGVARMLDSTFRPVRLVGRYAKGGNVHIVVTDTLEIRDHATVTASGVVTDAAGYVVVGSAEPDPVGPRLLALSDRSAPVAEALALLGTPALLGWFELYKLYEVLRSEVDPVAAGWTTKAQLSAFTASANRPDVSGADARHARMPGAAPQRTMTLPEAREYVTALVRTWLESLI